MAPMVPAVPMDVTIYLQNEANPRELGRVPVATRRSAPSTMRSGGALGAGDRSRSPCLCAVPPTATEWTGCRAQGTPGLWVSCMVARDGVQTGS